MSTDAPDHQGDEPVETTMAEAREQETSETGPVSAQPTDAPVPANATIDEHADDEPAEPQAVAAPQPQAAAAPGPEPAPLPQPAESPSVPAADPQGEALPDAHRPLDPAATPPTDDDGDELPPAPQPAPDAGDAWTGNRL